MIKFRVPATSANLGPGFDCLALALAVYDEIEMRLSDRILISVKGEGEQEISRDETNLMVRVAQQFCRHMGKPFQGIDIKLKRSIPLARGLGSSSAAIVGSLYGINALLGSPRKMEELLEIASELEGHADNVAAALYGGLVIVLQENGKPKAIKFPPPIEPKIILGIPNFEVYTSRARASLPANWGRDDVLFSLSRASLLVASLLSKQYDYLRIACEDRLHEPYRGAFVPGYEALRGKLLDAGALGVVISGSGPTVLVFTKSNVEKIRKIVTDNFRTNKIKCFTLTTRVSACGVG